MKTVKFKINSSKEENRLKNSPHSKQFAKLNSYIPIKKIQENKKQTQKKNIDIFSRRNSLFNFDRLRRDLTNKRTKNIPKIELLKGEIVIEPEKNRKIQSINSIVKYALDKIKKDYISPYIDRLIKPEDRINKTIKNEDKPIYYNLYKINEILLNKKSRLNLNFLENNYFLNNNEYLIKAFGRDEFRIVMRYLLGYIYINDTSSKGLTNKNYHKKKIVLNEFNYYILNNYKIIETEKDAIDGNIPTTGRKGIDLALLDNLLNLELNAEINKFDYPFLKWPNNHFLIKDMPKELIPNSIPNYYFDGNSIFVLLRGYHIYRKFNIDINSMNKIHLNIFFDKINEDMNTNYLVKSRIFNVVDNLSESSSDLEPKHTNNDIFTSAFKNSYKIKNFKHNTEIHPVEKLIKKLDDRKKEKKVSFILKEKLNKRKRHHTIRKKKKIREPYEDYEIIHQDDFYIDKTEKSSVLKTFNKEMFKLTSLKLRKGQKYKTRLHIKPKFNIIDNIKTLTSDKFIRKHRYFNTNVDKNNVFNNNYFKSNKNVSHFYKKYLFQYEFNTFNSRLFNNNNKNINNIKFKMFNNLDKQKKISFSIFSKKKVKFQDSSKFISNINNSIKDQLKTKNFIKGIIINYQKNHYEKKLKSLEFPELNKSNNDNNSIPKINKSRKNRNKTKQYKKANLTEKQSIIKDSFRIEDIFKHKVLKFNI